MGAHTDGNCARPLIPPFGLASFIKRVGYKYARYAATSLTSESGSTPSIPVVSGDIASRRPRHVKPRAAIPALPGVISSKRLTKLRSRTSQPGQHHYLTIYDSTDTPHVSVHLKAHLHSSVGWYESLLSRHRQGWLSYSPTMSRLLIPVPPSPGAQVPYPPRATVAPQTKQNTSSVLSLMLHVRRQIAMSIHRRHAL